MILSITLSLGVFNFRNTFKPADVDVLFPTPVPTKIVMMFRLFRDYSGTILVPFVLAIFGYRPTIGFFKSWQKGDAAGMSNVLRGAFISWVMLALAWVAISYAISFFLAKNEKKGDMIARIMGWVVGLTCIGSITGLMVYNLKSPTIETLSATTNHWTMQVIFFLPHAATKMVMGGYSGSLIQSLIGFGVLTAVCATCLSFAAKHSDWMYDQAATKGFQTNTMRDLMRKGDATGMYAERARMGKLRSGRIAARVSKLTLRGGWALIYKELIIQTRTGLGQALFMMLMVTLCAVMFALIPATGKRGFSTEIQPLFYMGIVGFMGVNMASATAYNSFVETLRRVEVIKPLPLNARQIAFYETISKTLFASVITIVPYLVGFCVKPQWWQYHLAGLIAGPVMAMALVAMVFLVVVLFPDFDDITQRSFRGFMQLLGMVVIFAPTAGLFAAGVFVKASPIIAAILSSGVNIGLTVLAATLAGRFYADFNPSE
jgi:hypothetical protein